MVSVGKVLQYVYDTQVASRPSHTRTSGNIDTVKDVKDMVELLQPEGLFTVKPGRHHSAFPEYEFRTNQSIVPTAFKARLIKHRKLMADRRRIVLNNRE